MNKGSKFGLAALFLAAAVTLAGCGGVNPISTEATQNTDVTYSVLFNRNGCEVGRFMDYGRPVYITTCPAGGVSASQSSHSESCGKNCTTTYDTHQTQVTKDAEGTVRTDLRVPGYN